jgi:hypothetical protein
MVIAGRLHLKQCLHYDANRDKLGFLDIKSFLFFKTH